MKTHYFLGTQYLGSSDRLWKWEDAQEGFPQNVMLCCPVCGDVWGRIVCDAPEIQHVPFRVACGKHHWPTKDEKVHSGSFIMRWRKTFNELPPAVLEYEFSRLINLEK